MLKPRDSYLPATRQPLPDRLPLGIAGVVLLLIGFVLWSPFLIAGGVLIGHRATRLAQRYL